MVKKAKRRTSRNSGIKLTDFLVAYLLQLLDLPIIKSCAAKLTMQDGCDDSARIGVQFATATRKQTGLQACTFDATKLAKELMILSSMTRLIAISGKCKVRHRS